MKQGSIVLPLYLVSGGQIQCRLTSDESTVDAITESF